MYIVTVLAVGLLIGALEKFVMSGPTTGGSIETMFLGHFWGRVRGHCRPSLRLVPDPLYPAGVVASIAGAILVLFINRLIGQSRRTD